MFSVPQVEQKENNQIQTALQKHSLKKQEYVIEQTTQKIYCHSCPKRTTIISKDFFYTFPDGKAVFFCNNQERDLWMKNNKINS